MGSVQISKSEPKTHLTYYYMKRPCSNNWRQIVRLNPCMKLIWHTKLLLGNY